MRPQGNEARGADQHDHQGPSVLGPRPWAETGSPPAPREADRPALADSLRLSEEVFRAIFEEAGVGMALVALDGRLIATNGVLREMLGYLDAELRGMTFPQFTYPEDIDADRELFSELVRGERGRYQLEERFIRKDGEILHARLTASLVRNPDGSPRWAVGMVEDVTELKHAGEERKRLRARLAHAQEEERRRIAEDLHDDPVQKLTALGIRLATLAQTLDSNDQRGQVAAVQEILSETIARLRWLTFDLRPPVLDREGLAEAVRQQLQRLQEETGWRWAVQDRLRSEPPPEVAAAAYRIVHEALANARKHSSASTVAVTLESDAVELRGRVADDGIGFDPRQAMELTPGHLGLASMRERAELFGGWLKVDSYPGRGTTVRFTIPLGATGT